MKRMRIGTNCIFNKINLPDTSRVCTKCTIICNTKTKHLPDCNLKNIYKILKMSSTDAETSIKPKWLSAWFPEILTVIHHFMYST